MEKEIRPLFLEKLEKVENMLKLTQEISDALEKKDSDELLKILNARQKLMKEIDLLDSRVFSYFNGDKKALMSFISEGNQEIKKTYDSIGAILKKIKALDDVNINGIKSLFDESKEDMKNLKQAETAMKGYGFYRAGGSGGAFIDTKK